MIDVEARIVPEADGDSTARIGRHGGQFEPGVSQPKPVSRDVRDDDMLGLNLAWYADILMTLTRTKDAP